MRARVLVAGLLLVGLTSGGRDTPVLTFALAGDLNLARGAQQVHGPAWAGAFTEVQAALRGDVVLANLESPLTGQPRLTGGIDLRASPAAVRALTPFTHLSVENNHALDGGPAGQAENRRLLREQGVTPVTRAPLYRSVRGVRVALLAYLDDGSPLPLAQVRASRREAPVVVVMPHWGAEYGTTTARQRQQARLLVQAGATLIVGSGPHVLQGSERLGPALVLYSLGNLLFDQPYPDAWLGAVVRVQVQGQQVQACAVPTLTRAGRVQYARGPEVGRALARLGMPACPAGRAAS